MRFRRRRGEGFFSGLVVGAVLGVGASAALAPQLHDGALRLHQEEQRWRNAIESGTRALNEAEVFLAQTESDFQAQLGSFAASFIPDGNPADTKSQSLKPAGRTD